MGRYSSRSLADDDVLTIGVNRAVVLFAEPVAQRRSGPRLLRELGEHPEGGAVGLYTPGVTALMSAMTVS